MAERETGRARVRRALNHEQGPVPLDIGGSPTSGIHVSMLAQLRDHYGLEKRPCKVNEPYQMLGMVEDDLRAAIGIDVTPLANRWTMFGFANECWKPWRTPWGQDVLTPGDFNVTETDDQIWIYAGGDTNYAPAGVMPKSGFFFDSTKRQPPLDEDTLDPADNCEEFNPISNEDLAYLRAQGEAAEQGPYMALGNLGGTGIGDIALVPGPMLKKPKGIRDVAEWYMATAANRDYVHAVFTRQTDIALENLAKIHDVLGDRIGIAFICGTDFGTQQSTFCSAATFDELYAPYYHRINGWIHGHTSWKCFKHSCGAVATLIPRMIEVGFDIFNPVQWTAAGMDMEKLKSEYGSDLAFWGGGVDTQRTLPFGTPQQVREEVLKACSCFARNGGFVFNTIHNIQAGTPIENLVAMIDAVRTFNGE